MNMYTRVNVFVYRMREVQTRLSFECAEPVTLEEVFLIALRKDFRVTKNLHQAFHSHRRSAF